MQDRYVGDENDFVKYYLLRFLLNAIPELHLGVCWYLTDPAKVDADNSQHDGHRINYLLNQGNWRRTADAALFDTLCNRLIKDGQVDPAARSVATIANSGILGKRTLFFAEEVPQDRGRRTQWLQRGIESLKNANLVFLDPDNSVSTQCSHTVKGGKWAAPSEALHFHSGTRSIAWISHPRRQLRATHHLATMAVVDHLDGLFCSVYQGQCGFHFLLCEQHHGIAIALRQLVRIGVEADAWGTWRYCDSDGVAINWQQTDPTPDEFIGAQDADAAADTDIWEFRPGVVVNDPGNLWRSRNAWIDVNASWEVVFLDLGKNVTIPVQFVPMGGTHEKHGVKPIRTKDNLAAWQRVSANTNNVNRRVLPALTRVIPFEDESDD